MGAQRTELQEPLVIITKEKCSIGGKRRGCKSVMTKNYRGYKLPYRGIEMHKHILIVYSKMSSYKKCCTLKIKRRDRKLTCIAGEDGKFVWVWYKCSDICTASNSCLNPSNCLCVFIPSPNMSKMLLKPTLQHLLSSTDVCLLLKHGLSWTN